MDFAAWSLLAGALLVLMALLGSVLQRLPLSTSMLYLGVGVLLSPWAFDVSTLDFRVHAHALERLAEIVVLASLFTSGLKLSPAIRDRRWVLPLRLAINSMVFTVFAIAAIAWVLLGWPIGAAVLLGAILAPTDPVLASDVQVTGAQDRDRLRFALTGEGGLNDGTAFPFVLLGLGLLGAREVGELGWRWFLVDGVLASLGGLACGAVMGLAVGKLVLYLRRAHREAVGLDDFIALGLVAASYGAAQLAHVNGFLAVFAAGVALRYLEQSQGGGRDSAKAVARAVAQVDTAAAEAVAVHPEHAPAYMAQAVLSFNEQIERIGELLAVVAIGALLWSVQWTSAALWFVPLLLLVVRPVAVFLGLLKSPSSAGQRTLIAWFGIRGVGSLFYLMYAINHGLPGPWVEPIAALTLSVVVASIVLHGISVTPLMAAYERAAARLRPARRKRS